MWEKGIPEQLLDPNIVDSSNITEVVRCIQIGLLCLQHHPDDRPNMTSVTVMLSSDNVLSLPKVPGFLIKNISIEAEQSCGRQESCSINEVTVSLLDAR